MSFLILRVSELTRNIKTILEEQFSFVWVEGELSNVTNHSSGHCYFTLKDDFAQVRAVMFRSASRLLAFKPENGTAVVVRGRLSVYEPRGEYQIIADTMEPLGKGSLQLAFEQTKRKLAAEGLFDPTRKKALPFLPQRIAVITSPDGAALRDILKIINRRFANLIIDILPVHVQGADASAEIIAGLEAVNALPDIDVVIVTRGGGSLEDLWAFNDEGVARAIAACRFPVISAVGHETDFTLADFVADLRAPTPSAAAEMVVEKKEAFIETISSFGHRLAQSLRLCLREWKNRFELTQAGLRDPRRGLEDLRLRTDDFTERLHSVALQRLQNKRELRSRLIEKLLYVSPLTTIQQLQHNVENQKQTILLHMRWKLERCLQTMEKVVAQLDSSSPLAILKRGYSITRTWPEKEVIRDVRSIQPAQVLHIKLYRGTILCRVEETSEDE